jgi:hypothetical protein
MVMNKPSNAKICDAIRQAIFRLPRATDAAVIERATAALGIDRWRVELVYEANFGLKDAN